MHRSRQELSRQLIVANSITGREPQHQAGRFSHPETDLQARRDEVSVRFIGPSFISFFHTFFPIIFCI